MEEIFYLSHKMNINGLNPAQSTVYVSNLPYDLQPLNIQTIFERYGRIVKVTLLTVKETRKSKGVAFILFFRAEDAKNCADDANNSELLGNVLKACIARDNGRRPNMFKKPYDSGYNHYNYNPRYQISNNDFNFRNSNYNAPNHINHNVKRSLDNNNKPNFCINLANTNFRSNPNYRYNPLSVWKQNNI